MKVDYRKIVYQLFKYNILFFYGGGCYLTIELLYRQYTSYEMMYLGGLCFIAIGLINSIFTWNMSLLLQGLIGGLLIITPLELIFGLIFNSDYHIWNYLHQPFNYKGQICLLFSILWCLISIAVVILDDYLRYFIFGEDKPHYKLI